MTALVRRDVTIRVGVIHGPGSKVAPVWFDLDRRKHVVRRITNMWKERRGETVTLHFHVVDDGALYELCFNLTDVTWSLEGIEAL